jgi:hypothetical protein
MISIQVFYLNVAQTTIQADNLARQEAGSLASRIHNSAGNLLWGTVSLNVLLGTEFLGQDKILWGSIVGIGRTGSNDVDCDALLAKLLSPRQRKSVESSLASRVERGNVGSGTSHDSADVDDAAARRCKMRQRSLDEQVRAQNVGVEDGIKLFDG